MNVSLTQGLHRSIQQTPKAIATVSGDRRQTFERLGARVARLAGALAKLGARTDDRIGMLALGSDRYLGYYLAVPWLGGIVNPCNTRWSVAEIAYSLDDCETRILVVDDAFAKLVPELRRASKSLAIVIHAGDGPTPPDMLSYEALLEDAAPVDDVHRSGDDVVGIFYTGGTTGSPKGVMLTHGSIYASSLTMLAALPRMSAPVYLHAAPMFHMADNAAGMLHVIRGSKHVFLPSFTPKGALEAIQNEKVTATLIVPTMVQMIVDHPAIGEHDLSSLVSITYGASAISEAVLARAMTVLPHADFTQAYGMTELSPVATLLTHEHHLDAGKLRSAGRAAFCSDVRIVDEADREVPTGTVGEVVVRGPNLMKGYWNRPELTAETLRGGWMHTGDGGYLDEDGFLFVVDRIKDMIVSGGENVYSAEVENALSAHPAVAMCAVIGVPDEKWGERVHAVVVLRAGASASSEEIIAHCKSRIANYKCPRSVEFRPELPLSGAGKILKKVLREERWSGNERRIG